MWYNYGFMTPIDSYFFPLSLGTKGEQNYTLTQTLLLCWFLCFPKWIIFVVPPQSLKEIEDMICRNIVIVAVRPPRGHASYWYSLLKPKTVSGDPWETQNHNKEWETNWWNQRCPRPVNSFACSCHFSFYYTLVLQVDGGKKNLVLFQCV